jgi:hypothetical protein
VNGSGTSSTQGTVDLQKVCRPSVDSCIVICGLTDGLSSYRSVVPHARAISGESRDTSGPSTAYRGTPLDSLTPLDASTPPPFSSSTLFGSRGHMVCVPFTSLGRHTLTQPHHDAWRPRRYLPPRHDVLRLHIMTRHEPFLSSWSHLRFRLAAPTRDDLSVPFLVW